MDRENRYQVQELYGRKSVVWFIHNNITDVYPSIPDINRAFHNEFRGDFNNSELVPRDDHTLILRMKE